MNNICNIVNWFSSSQGVAFSGFLAIFGGVGTILTIKGSIDNLIDKKKNEQIIKLIKDSITVDELSEKLAKAKDELELCENKTNEYKKEINEKLPNIAKASALKDRYHEQLEGLHNQYAQVLETKSKLNEIDEDQKLSAIGDLLKEDLLSIRDKKEIQTQKIEHIIILLAVIIPMYFILPFPFNNLCYFLALPIFAKEIKAYFEFDNWYNEAITTYLHQGCFVVSVISVFITLLSGLLWEGKSRFINLNGNLISLQLAILILCVIPFAIVVAESFYLSVKHKTLPAFDIAIFSLLMIYILAILLASDKATIHKFGDNTHISSTIYMFIMIIFVIYLLAFGIVRIKKHRHRINN
nr:hypothetical protein [uncultured Butyrivibrio sp.]